MTYILAIAQVITFTFSLLGTNIQSQIISQPQIQTEHGVVNADL